MSDTDEWSWQGFLGPATIAAASKEEADRDTRCGARVPIYGQAPLALDVGQTQGIFAVMTRKNDPIPTPPGLLQVNPAIIGRMVNA